MACQITYNDNNTLTVNAPNGQKSILFEKIKALPEVKDDRDAINSWLKVYTDTFKEWFGTDWETLSKSEQDKLIKEGYLDSNGEPSVFYRGDYTGLESFNYSNSVGKFGQGIYIAENKSQAESFAKQTSKEVYPVFLKPNKSINFKNVTEFQTAAGKFNKIKTVPKQEDVKAYVDSVHLKGETIVGTGIMGREFNVPSKDLVSSIFLKGLKISGGILFDSMTVTDQFMTEEFQESRKSDQFVQEFIDRLASNLGMDYNKDVVMVSKDEASLITQEAQNPWSGQPAFFFNGKVHFVKGQLNFKTAFHEFAHPLVQALSKENNKLFNRIYKDITDDNQSFLAEAIAEYPSLDPNHEQIKKEVLVKAMTHSAEEQGKLNPEVSTGIAAAIKKLLFALKQILRKLMPKAKLTNLSSTTTVQELAGMLTDSNWNIDFSTVSESDIVSYMEEMSDVVKDIKKFGETESGRVALHQQIEENIKITREQLQRMEQEGDTQSLKIVLSDQTGRQDQEEMLQNMQGLRSKDALEKKLNEEYSDLDEFEKRTDGLFFNLNVMDSSVKRIKKHIKDLVDEPNQKKAIAQVNYYTKTLEEWDIHLERFLRRSEEQGLSTASSLVQSILDIREDITRGKKDIQSIYKHATKDAFYEIFEPLVKNVTKQKNARIADLKAKIEKGGHAKTLNAEIKRVEAELKVLPTKEKMLDYITGKMGDTGFWNSWLENFSSNQDPSIASFSMYIKKNLSEVQTKVHQKYNEFANELDPLVKSLGMDASKLNKFSDKFLFLDDSYKRSEDGEIETFQVHTFLNEFKGFKFQMAKMNDDIANAEVKWLEDPSDANAEEYSKAITSKEEHVKYFYNKKYVDDFYHADDILDKSPIGRKAKAKKEAIFSEINHYQKTHQDEYELYEDFETVEVLWREYKQIFSMYDDKGELKLGEDLEIAQILQEHREAKRKYYKYTEIDGAFETSMNQFMMKQVIKMSDEGFIQGTDSFIEELTRRKEVWLDRNTKAKIKDEFYTYRQNILDKIADIMNVVNTKEIEYQRTRLAVTEPGTPEAQAIEIQLENLTSGIGGFQVILDSLQGRRDNDGQPIAPEMTEELLSIIKETEIKMDAAKQEIASASGLSKADWLEMGYYYDKMDQGDKLTPDEMVKFKKLKIKKSKIKLPAALKEKLFSLYSMLNELQVKVPTDYYVNALDDFWQDMEHDENAPKEITNENIIDFSKPAFVKELFKKSPEFEAWFNKNHILKQKYVKEVGIQDVYERTYAWSIVKPKDEKYIEKTDVHDKEGKLVETVTGVPASKYFKREVKPEYQTGYNAQTGQVDLVVGKHISKPGLNSPDLPKSLAQMETVKGMHAEQLAEQPFAYDHYINHDYHSLKRQDPTAFAALNVLTKFHIESQDGLEQHGKLGLELPRFRKDLYEYVTQSSLKEETSNKWNELVSGFTQHFGKRKDDLEDGLNFEEQMAFTEMDAYSGESGKVPIRGKYQLDSNQVSKDITTSLMMYYQSAEQNKVLRKIQPIARGFQKLASERNPADLKAMSKMAYNQKKGMEYIEGKTNNRKKVIDSMVEIFFEGKKLFDGSNNPTTVKLINASLGMASHAFFAFDITSAMKNFLGAQFQIALEGAGGKYFKYSDWHRGRPWAYSAMWEISGQIYKTTAKSKKVQLIDMFDAIQGRFEDKFGESLSRSFWRDAASMSWTTSHRKWLETEASLQLFSAIMHGTKVQQTLADGSTKKIKYMDAWEINAETKQIELVDGVDKAWDINGEKFNEVKFKNHEVSNLLQGAYADFDQPMMNRFLLWRMVSSMRKYFTKMMLHRYGHKGSLWDPKERFNLSTNDMHMGYYMRNISTMRKLVESKGRHIMYMGKDEWRAFKMGFLEIFKLWVVSASYMWIWGFDPDDSDKWKKMKERSGAMPWLGLTDEEWSENWNLQGWLGNHLLLLSMHVEAENEHFIPWPGYGMRDMATLFTESSVASGPSIEGLMTLFYDLIYTMSGDDSVVYKKDVGALNIQQEGENKFWKHLYKMMAIKGKFIDPVTSTKNFHQSREKLPG